MNRHLEQVFRVLLPELERVQIDYWVYGGIGIAACVGEFIRTNGDVDVFVREIAYEDARSVLRAVCNKNSFAFLDGKPLKRNQRPKFEIAICNRKRLSVVPVYLKGNSIEFRFSTGPRIYPREILERVERNVGGYRFFTPPCAYIRTLFTDYLDSRSDKKKILIDARAIGYY